MSQVTSFQTVRGASGAAISFPTSGVSVGDLLMIMITDGSTGGVATTMGSGNATTLIDGPRTISTGAFTKVWTRILDTSDIAAGTVTFASGNSGEPVLFKVLHSTSGSFASASCRSWVENGGGSLSYGSQSPGGTSKGFFVMLMDSQVSNTPATVSASGWAAVIPGTPFPANTYWAAIDQNNFGYSGGAVTFSGFNTTNIQFGCLLEGLG